MSHARPAKVVGQTPSIDDINDYDVYTTTASTHSAKPPHSQIPKIA